MASGRFRAHVATEELDLADTIEDASLDEVLAWARARSDVVLIRLWDGDYFSAGEVNPHPDEYPEWTGPPEPPRRRRPRGLEALDNTEDDPPVPWDVRFDVPGRSDEEVLAAVLEDERLRPAPPDPRYAEAAEARVIVEAPTKAQAEAIAGEVAREHLHPLVPEREGIYVGMTHGVYPLAPDAPELFGNFRHSHREPQDGDGDGDDNGST